eukprot:713310-Pyramimonas_sp.AAC.1
MRGGRRSSPTTSSLITPLLHGGMLRRRGVDALGQGGLPPRLAALLQDSHAGGGPSPRSPPTLASR